jgi:hypothetical protein
VALGGYQVYGFVLGGKVRKPLNYVRIVVLFFTFLVFFGMARKVWAGGQEYYLPSPEGNCGVLSVDGQDDADFINHRGKYLMMVKSDELKILNMCNTKQAKCYAIKAACGDHVHMFVFWRAKK